MASVDKYYKSVKDSVTWQEARDACSSEGTILVELRTLEEYQAIRPIYGKIMFKLMLFMRYNFIFFLEFQLDPTQWPIFGQFWTGLRNPNKEICYDAGCVNKLKWDSDGSFLSNWHDPSHGFYVNSGDDCLRYMRDNMNDQGCDERYYYICEFQCPTTTTTTTTTTTVTTTPQGEMLTT